MHAREVPHLAETGLPLLVPFESQFAPQPMAVFYHKFCFGWPPVPMVRHLVVATRRMGAAAPRRLGLRAKFLVPSACLRRGDAREFIGGVGRAIEPVESHPAMRANATPPSD